MVSPTRRDGLRVRAAMALLAGLQGQLQLDPDTLIETICGITWTIQAGTSGRPRAPGYARFYAIRSAAVLAAEMAQIAIGKRAMNCWTPRNNYIISQTKGPAWGWITTWTRCANCINRPGRPSNTASIFTVG